MAKIGLDLRFWRSGTGGIGRYSRNLLSELLKLDAVNEYTAIITPQDEAEFQLRAPNLRRLVVDIPHFSYAEQGRFVKILNQEKFDLVHFANFNHPILYRRPFVITIHDMIMHLFPKDFRRGSLISHWAYSLIFKDCWRAQKVIVPSVATQNDLDRLLKFPASKVAVIPEGNETLFRIHTDREKIAVKERLKLPKQYLLFVSRWEKYKGLPALLSSHAELAKKYPDLGLVICGRPDSQNPEVTQLVEQAKSANKNVVTPGFVNDADLAAIYAAATVYVHPSWYEGFGIMILEAFASGTPVVTSNTSSLPEVVGDAGLLVDPQNTAELTTAIDQILSNKDLAADLVEKGLERVKLYSWSEMVRQTLVIYTEILN